MWNQASESTESNGETKSLSYKSYLTLARGDSNFLEKQGRDSFSSGIRRLVFLTFLLPQKRKFHVQNQDEAVQSWMRSFGLDSRGSNRRQRHVNAIARQRSCDHNMNKQKRGSFIIFLIFRRDVVADSPYTRNTKFHSGSRGPEAGSITLLKKCF